MTLACEDANSKLVDAVTVADVDAEKRVEDSSVQIWKLKFGYKVMKQIFYAHQLLRLNGSKYLLRGSKLFTLALQALLPWSSASDIVKHCY